MVLTGHGTGQAGMEYGSTGVFDKVLKGDEELFYNSLKTVCNNITDLLLCRSKTVHFECSQCGFLSSQP